MKRSYAIATLFVGLIGLCAGQLSAQGGWPHRPIPKIKSFTVSKDETLAYPSDLVDLPDEHTTFLPVYDPKPFPWAWWNASPDTYLVFASSRIAHGFGGTVALQTKDLKTFTFATDRGYSDQVMSPPVDFTVCDSNPANNMEFDENYAAPGTVLQDPTRPPGNLIMFYEAENHCPTATNQQPFYATVGFARSSDGGRTWPQPPVDSELGGKDRYPVLKIDVPEPTANYTKGMGDAIPSALVDGGYLYVAYSYHSGKNESGDLIRIARARLDQDDHGFGWQDWDSWAYHSRLEFWKWNNHAFSQPGIGGVDAAVLPAGGCTGRQQMPEVSYNEDLGLYY